MADRIGLETAPDLVLLEDGTSFLLNETQTAAEWFPRSRRRAHLAPALRR